MDRRTAKREALWRAASTVRDAMASGWPLELYDDEKDGEAVSDALYEVIAELERRGHR